MRRRIPFLVLCGVLVASCDSPDPMAVGVEDGRVVVAMDHEVPICIESHPACNGGEAIPPSNLVVVPRSDGQVGVEASWQQNDPDPDQFILFFRVSGSGGFTTSQITGGPGNITQATLGSDQLEPATVYEFAVQMFNGLGQFSDISNIATATTCKTFNPRSPKYDPTMCKN